PLARFWLHNGFLDIEKEKMSKSLGNVLLVRDLLAEAPGEAIRYALLTAHYRKPLDWSAAGLARARHALDRLYLTLSELPGPDEAQQDEAPKGVIDALEDDLNTPKAFAELFALAREANASADQGERRALKGKILAGGWLLGLLQQNPEAWLKTAGMAIRQMSGTPQAGPATVRGQLTTGPTLRIDEQEIERLIEARAEARRGKNFAEADRIRDQLAAEGVIIEDLPDRTRWRLAG
ncbi:MAG: DALR domain-containing protein, partial [Geminicoccales bacterium]